MSSLVDQTIGKYKIIEQISKGGTATVFRAKDTVLERDVAFKILHTHLEESENILDRFKQEARMIAQLDHPNIVNVFDFFEHEGRAVVIMELIEGDTLSSLVRLPYAIPENYVMMIASELLKGLREAHRKGIVHRDIKPANILISPSKGIKLSDFGLAKLQESEVGLTQTGMYVGTPSFSSPEQIQGLPLDQRSDIFSLGLTLFVLAKKAHAFKEKGDSKDTIARKIVEGEMNPRLNVMNFPLSPEVEAILNRAIQVDPMARYKSCDEMMKEIEHLIREKSIWPYDEKLNEFLIDPEAACLEIAQSKTEQLTPHKGTALRSQVGKLNSLAMGLVGALIVLVSGLAVLWNLNSYPTWPIELKASGENRSYSGPSGIRTHLVGLEPKAASEWLVLFENTNSVFDNQILRHEYRDRNTYRTSYVTQWGGFDFSSIVSKNRNRTDKGFMVYAPWKPPYSQVDVDFDSEGVKQIDAHQMILNYLGRRKPNEIRFYSRSTLIEKASAQLKQRSDSVSQLCSNKIDFRVAWADLSDEALYNIDPVRLCSRPLHLVQYICSEQVFDVELKEEIDSIICSFGELNRSEILNKKLIWQINPKKPSDISELYEFIRNRYKID